MGAMLHGFVGKVSTGVGMLTLGMWFCKSPVSMFFERLSSLNLFLIA